MTQVFVNGNLYSDDGSTSKDMQHGGHRTWLLPMLSDMMFVMNSVLGGSFSVSFDLARPLTGATITTALGLGALVIDPATPIAALTVVAPPDPTEGQIFELSTTQTITLLTVNSAGSEAIEGGPAGMLAAGGGLSWRFSAPDTTWYRRF